MRHEQTTQWAAANRLLNLLPSSPLPRHSASPSSHSSHLSSCDSGVRIAKVRRPAWRVGIQRCRRRCLSQEMCCPTSLCCISCSRSSHAARCCTASAACCVICSAISSAAQHQSLTARCWPPLLLPRLLRLTVCTRRRALDPKLVVTSFLFLSRRWLAAAQRRSNRFTCCMHSRPRHPLLPLLPCHRRCRHSRHCRSSSRRAMCT